MRNAESRSLQIRTETNRLRTRMLTATFGFAPDDENGIAAEQPVHPHVVFLGRDRVRHPGRRDAPEVLEGGFRPGGAGLAAHGPDAARSLPARDPETNRRLHPLCGRSTRHGLVGHRPGGELRRAGAPTGSRGVCQEAGNQRRDPGRRVDGCHGVADRLNRARRSRARRRRLQSVRLRPRRRTSQPGGIDLRPQRPTARQSAGW
jgi:hypothetical protein